MEYNFHNMAFKEILLVLIVSVLFTDAYRSTEKIERDESNPDKCVLKKYNMTVDFETPYPVPGECEQMTCDTTYHVTYIGCSPVGVPYSCSIISLNPDGPYPTCCVDTIICPPSKPTPP